MRFLRTLAGYRRTCDTIREELNLFIILDKMQSFQMREKHAACNGVAVFTASLWRKQRGGFLACSTVYLNRFCYYYKQVDTDLLELASFCFEGCTTTCKQVLQNILRICSK